MPSPRALDSQAPSGSVFPPSSPQSPPPRAGQDYPPSPHYELGSGQPGAGIGVDYIDPGRGQANPRSQGVATGVSAGVQKAKASFASAAGRPQLTRQYLVGLIEVIKLLDWFTELLKIVCGQTVAGEYYGWALFSFAMSTWLLVHRGFDQIALLTLSHGWAGEYLCMLMLCACPIACPFFPLAHLTFALYRKEHPNSMNDERAIFAQRPISTLLLGLPFSGIMSMFLADVELVMHPAQVHIRAMQAVYSTMFSNIPDFVVDLVVILNAKDNLWELVWYYLSFFYSVAELLLVCFMTVHHIHEAEKKKPLPPSHHYRHSHQRGARPGSRPVQPVQYQH